MAALPDNQTLLSAFKRDEPYPPARTRGANLIEGRIDGCAAYELKAASDKRGDLFELMTLRDGDADPIVHVYQVFCEPGSIRAWIYHAKQWDRLSYTAGEFRIALYDLRPESPTRGNLVTLTAGSASPVSLYIPPFVAHGVQNTGPEKAPFVNMPTRIYDLAEPDKYRLPHDSPLIPYRW